MADVRLGIVAAEFNYENLFFSKEKVHQKKLFRVEEVI